MLYRHVFSKISSEFRGLSGVFLNFVGFRAAQQPREISEALSEVNSAHSYTERLACIIHLKEGVEKNI